MVASLLVINSWMLLIEQFCIALDSLLALKLPRVILVNNLNSASNTIDFDTSDLRTRSW